MGRDVWFLCLSSFLKAKSEPSTLSVTTLCQMGYFPVTGHIFCLYNTQTCPCSFLVDAFGIFYFGEAFSRLCSFPLQNFVGEKNLYCGTANP